MQAIVKSHLGRLKAIFAFGVMAVCGTLLWQHIAAVPREDLLATFQHISPWQWAVACIATMISFSAVGRYDAVWHRRLATGVNDRRARRTGMIAIAIGQTIGASAFTGAFIRWHLLPSLGLKTTTSITIGVSLSFLTCWAVFAVGAGLWLRLLPTLLTFATIATALVFAAMFRSLWIKHFSRDMLTLLGLTAIDIGFASLALWALLPDASAAIILPVLAAYVVALGAGLISNAPGGLGAFDLSLIALLPSLPEADLLVAILAFRMIFYVGPAIIAGICLAASHLRQSHQAGVTTSPISDLCQQGAKLRQVGQAGWVLRTHVLGTVALEPRDATPDLHHFQSRTLGFSALYKADARLALRARNAGWSVRRIAEDALIDPQTWTIDGPKMRQLRRKLTQATKAGVRIFPAQGVLPRKQMGQIATEWANAHGGELGYSVGRYCPDYVGTQRVYLIMAGDILHGFITLQTRPDTWVIDVIRHGRNMPNGAMHLAVTQVIVDAKTSGVTSVSLGAVPTGKTVCKHQLKMRTAKAGLVQFKQSFQPQWTPLYHAAPTRTQWAISMLHVMWNVQRPVPRMTRRGLGAVKSLIMFSPYFHLISPRQRDMPAQHFACAQPTIKAASHDQRIRKTTR